MAAPSNTVWGSTINSKTRIGIAISTSSSSTSVTVTAQVWFWSKYGIDEHWANNSFYFDWDKSSASTNRGGVGFRTTVSTGSGWSTSNQVLLKSYSKTYSKGTSAQTKYVAAALSEIEVSSGTMRASTSFSIPALASYRVTYNANGGSGAPSAQTKYYGKTLKLSTTKPTRNGYNFKGWGTSADAESASYQPGGNYTSNASITLYAVWEIGVLIEFEIPEEPTISIPDASGTGLAKLANVVVPFNVDYVTANYNTNIYYRICYADTLEGAVGNYSTNSLGKVTGPTTANKLTASGTPNITITAELLTKAIQAQKSSNEAVFVIQVCTGDNSFSSALTSKVTFSVNLTNFKIIDGELYGAWWESSTKMKIILEYLLPLSYSLNGSPLIQPKLTNGDTVTNITGSTTKITTEEDCKRVRYTFEITSPAEDYSNFELSDGLSSDKVYVRIVPYNKDQSIVINKSDKSIEAIEFIEHSKLYGFQRGGRVYFPDFTEISENDIGMDALDLMMYDMKERD